VHTRSQNTIKKKVTIEGIGLHSGNSVKMCFIPAPPNTGIIFKRVDLEDEPQKTSINVAEMMNICYNRIWNSEFNDDLTDVSDHYGNTPTIEKERNKILRYYQDHKTYPHTELPVFYEALENFSLEDMLHIIEKEFLVPEWADIEEVQVCHILHFAQSIPGNKTFFDFTSLIYRSLMSGDIV
jgi:hypothetical protein